MGRRKPLPPPVRKRPLSRFVYFVQADALKLIKVGVADDVDRRLRSLRGSSPDTLTLLAYVGAEDAEGYEAHVHEQFDDCRVHGEWFRPEADLVEYIRWLGAVARQKRQELLRDKLEIVVLKPAA